MRGLSDGGRKNGDSSGNDNPVQGTERNTEGGSCAGFLRNDGGGHDCPIQGAAARAGHADHTDADHADHADADCTAGAADIHAGGAGVLGSGGKAGAGYGKGGAGGTDGAGLFDAADGTGFFGGADEADARRGAGLRDGKPERRDEKDHHGPHRHDRPRDSGSAAEDAAGGGGEARRADTRSRSGRRRIEGAERRGRARKGKAVASGDTRREVWGKKARLEKGCKEHVDARNRYVRKERGQHSGFRRVASGTGHRHEQRGLGKPRASDNGAEKMGAGIHREKQQILRRRGRRQQGGTDSSGLGSGHGRGNSAGDIVFPDRRAVGGGRGHNGGLTGRLGTRPGRHGHNGAAGGDAAREGPAVLARIHAGGGRQL